MIGETEIKEMATMAAEAKLKAHCVYSNFNETQFTVYSN